MSAILFSIAVVLLIWFIRDCQNNFEEAEARLKVEDEKEAERNKKDPIKRKRAITATIEKKKLHVNKSNKDHLEETESSTSRSSSINTHHTHPSCNTSVSNDDHDDHSWHDEECGGHNDHGNDKNDTDDNDQNESVAEPIVTITKAMIDTDNVRDDRENDVDDFDNMCSICFEPYSNDQELSWSKTNKCQHVFHSECLMPWLMKHEDCPYCRTTLMTSKDFLDRTYTDSPKINTDNSESDIEGQQQTAISNDVDIDIESGIP